MICTKVLDTETSETYKTKSVHYPRYNRKKRAWTCDCDEYALDGWYKPCQHIEEAMKVKKNADMVL